MQLTPRRHELLSVYLLGAGTLFLYLGYLTQGFIAESVIHSIHSRDSERISQFAGYYGTAYHYCAFAISSLVTPSIQAVMSSKWILTIASALFAVNYLVFFHVTDFLFYSSQILMGIGYSLFNNGEGAYLSEHSSHRTIESNTGIETAVGHSCMFIGGIALMLIFYITATPAPLPEALNSASTMANVSTFKSFSDDQIYFFYGTFFALNMVSILIYALLPTKQYDSIASKSTTVLPKFKTQIKQLWTTIFAPNLLLLVPFFLYMGFIFSFLLAVFPTALNFTGAFNGDAYIVAIFSIGMGVSEIIGGVFVRRLIKRLGKWGLVFTMSLHFTCVALGLTGCALTVPIQATIEPTNDTPVGITPSRITVTIISILFGMGDFTITLSRAVICQVAVPESRMEVFSLSRVFQCISSCIILILSPHMNLIHWLAILAVALASGTLGFIAVAVRTSDRNNTIGDKKDSQKYLEQM